MDRIASLSDRAGNLRRNLFASLPPSEQKLATMLFTADLEETIGRQLGAELLKAGVTGMPDPGPKWNPASRQPALTLPANYLRHEIAGIVIWLRSKVRDMEIVSDGMSEYVLFVNSGKVKIDPVPLASALSHAKMGMLHRCLDVLKHVNVQRRHEESMHSMDDEGTDTLKEFPDAAALQDMMRDLGPTALHKLSAYLVQHVGPWAPKFVELFGQGWTPTEMVTEKKLVNDKGEIYPFSAQAIMKPRGMMDKIRDAIGAFYREVLKEPLPGEIMPFRSEKRKVRYEEPLP